MRVSFVMRMVWLTVLLIVAATLGGGASAYLVANDIVEKEIQFAGQSLAHNLSSSIVTIITKPGAQGELQVVLNNMLAVDREARIEDAVIVSDALQVLAAKDPSQVGLTYSTYGGLDKLSAIDVVRIPGSGTRIAAPVQWGKNTKYTLGFVVISLGEQAFTAARNRILTWFSVLFLLAIIAAVLLTRWALRRALHSVVQLGEAARALADGNSEYPLPATKRKDEIGEATRSFLAMRQAQGIFARFSNPALVREILAGQAPDRPQEVQLAIGFGDGVGFTDWSSAQGAAQVAGFLSDYFTLLGHLIEQHDGIVEKFIGDAVMSYYGLASRAHDAKKYGTPQLRDAARSAIRAHVYGQKVLTIANELFQRYQRRPVLHFRFGVATGKCVVGPMGARGIKLDYTIIGNTVNLAARLEGLASPGGLVIDNFTYLNADGERFLDAYGPMTQTVKGIAQPVPMYHVRGFREPEENARMRATLQRLFHEASVLEVLGLSDKQRIEFHRGLNARLTDAELRLLVPKMPVSVAVT